MVRKRCLLCKLRFLILIITIFVYASYFNISSFPNAIAQMIDDNLEIQNQFENDNYKKATVINPGEYPGLICQDDDWYKINVPDLGNLIEANLKVTIQFSHMQGDLDLILYSTKTSPNDYNFLDISGLTANEEVISASVPPGDYLIRIYGYKGAKNNYKMIVEILYPCQYVPYEWMDISDEEQAVLLLDDDYQEIDIGFDFKFYGQIHNKVKVSSNGYLTFADQTNPSFNPISPTPISATHRNAPPISIFSYWMNLRPDIDGGVFYRIDQSNPNCRKLIVEWRDVPRNSPGEGVSFQAVLFECTNQILLQYQDVTFTSQNDGYSLGSGATVGVANGKKTANSINRIATQFLYKEPILTGETALMFTPSLDEPLRVLSTNPIDGDIQIQHLDQQIDILLSQQIDGNILDGSFSIDPFVNGEWVVNQNRITFNHHGDPFVNGSFYKVTLSANLVRDCFGNSLFGDIDYTFSFEAISINANQPDIEVLPTSLSFGTLVVNETSVSSVINIFNKGNEDLNIESLILSDSENFSFDANGGSNPLGNLPAIIASGENRSIIVKFIPSVEEIFNVTLEITSNDPNRPIIDILLHGTGISTPNGWTTYDLEKCFGTDECLTSPVITALKYDDNEILWIGSAPYEVGSENVGGGVCAYNLYTGAFSCFDENNGLAGNRVVDIALGPQGELWVATDDVINGHGAGVSRFIGAEIFDSYDLTQIGTNDDLWITDIAVDNNSHLWVATLLSGLFEFDGSGWNHYNSPADSITSLKVDPFGKLWIGTLYNGLFVKEPFWPPTRINLNLGEYISEIAVDPNGNLWIVSILGNENSLIFMNPDELLPISIAIPDSLANIDINNINHLFINPITGILFIASDDGFYEFDSQNWNHFGFMNSGLPSLYINSIMVDPYNDYWVGTEEGLSHFNSALPNILGGIYGDTGKSDNLPIDTGLFLNFSESMDRESTESAFEMVDLVHGSIVSGSFHWNENSTVIKFEPTSSLAYNTIYEVRIFKNAKDRAGMTIDLNIGEGANFRPYTISTKAKSTQKTSSTNQSNLYTRFLNYYWPNNSLSYWTGYSIGNSSLRIPTGSSVYPQFRVDPYSNYQFMRIPQTQSSFYPNFNNWNIISPSYYTSFTSNIYQIYRSSLQGLNSYPNFYQNR